MTDGDRGPLIIGPPGLWPMRGSDVAPAIDTAAWVFVVMRLSGVAFSPEKGAALIPLLKVEGRVLLGLFLGLTPSGKGATR